MKFHAKDGLSFERMEDGSVRVSVEAGPASFSTVLNQDTWASCVASVSPAGDTAHNFQMALNFHIGENDSPEDYLLGG